MPSLGHVLGDEGSGADIGKHLLRDALYGQMPADLVAMLFPNGMDLPSILERIHRSAAPQAYLASFTARLADQLTDTYAHDLIVSRFFALTRILAHFFSAQEYQEVRAIGSVAFGFQGILQEALAHRRMNLTSVQHDPMPGLVKYHAVAMR